MTERGSGLPGVNWSGANLRGADLRHMDLRNAVLDGAKLLGADLRGSRLAGCRLRRTAMIGALVDPGALDNSDTFGAALPDSTVERQFAAATRGSTTSRPRRRGGCWPSPERTGVCGSGRTGRGGRSAGSWTPPRT